MRHAKLHNVRRRTVGRAMAYGYNINYILYRGLCDPSGSNVGLSERNLKLNARPSHDVAKRHKTSHEHLARSWECRATHYQTRTCKNVVRLAATSCDVVWRRTVIVRCPTIPGIATRFKNSMTKNHKDVVRLPPPPPPHPSPPPLPPLWPRRRATSNPDGSSSPEITPSQVLVEFYDGLGPVRTRSYYWGYSCVKSVIF